MRGSTPGHRGVTVEAAERGDLGELRGTGRKICTLIAAMLAGATRIVHLDVLRAGATRSVSGLRVMATRRSTREALVRRRPDRRRWLDLAAMLNALAKVAPAAGFDGVVTVR